MSTQTSLPSGWDEVSLGEIARINPRDFGADITPDTPVSFIPMAAVEAGSGLLDPSKSQPWGTLAGKSFTRFTEDDVLFAKITPCMENGKFALARGLVNGLGVGSTEFHVVRSPRGLFPKFVLYFLLQESTRRRARAVMSGAVGQQRVPTDFLEELKIPLPPKNEQERIVAEIEKQLTRLDAAIASLQRVRANFKRHRASVLQAAVEGRFVPRVGPWSRASLGDILESLRNGISTKPDSEDGLPILRISAVRPGQVDATDVRFLDPKRQNYDSYLLRRDDLLFTRYNGNPQFVGVCGMVRELVRPTVYPDKLIRAQIQRERAIPAYLQIALNAGVSRAFIASRVRTTAGQSGISGGDLRSVPVDLPPLVEQESIIAEVERRLSVIEALEVSVANGLRRAERLRQSMLKRAFEGRLVPQDPNDEPASVLLERIQAERRLMPTKGRHAKRDKGVQTVFALAAGKS